MPEIPLPRFMRRPRPVINAASNRSNNQGVSRQKVHRKGEKEAAQAITEEHRMVLHVGPTGRRTFKPAEGVLFENIHK